MELKLLYVNDGVCYILVLLKFNVDYLKFSNYIQKICEKEFYEKFCLLVDGQLVYFCS